MWEITTTHDPDLWKIEKIDKTCLKMLEFIPVVYFCPVGNQRSWIRNTLKTLITDGRSFFFSFFLNIFWFSSGNWFDDDSHFFPVSFLPFPHPCVQDCQGQRWKHLCSVLQTISRHFCLRYKFYRTIVGPCTARERGVAIAPSHGTSICTQTSSIRFFLRFLLLLLFH